MSQLTLYLDAETEEKLKTAAKAAGVSRPLGGGPDPGENRGPLA